MWHFPFEFVLIGYYCLFIYFQVNKHSCFTTFEEGRQAHLLYKGRELVAMIFIIIFFSVAYFSHGRSAQIQKRISQKLMGTPKIRNRPFSDPVGHFGAHWRPFWMLKKLSNQKTYLAKVN